MSGTLPVFRGCTAGLLVLAGSSVALAQQQATLTSWLGTQVELERGDFPTLLDSGGQIFSAEDMAELDDTLQSSGVQTSNRISILLAETGAGLSLITLFDGVSEGGSGDQATVTASSFIPTTATWQYNVDNGGSFSSFPLGDQTVLNGAFVWNSGIETAAFSISNLQTDDTGAISLAEIIPGSLDPTQTIQLLTSSGGVWSVAESFDFLTNPDGSPDFEYFTFEIGPVPAPAALALLGLAGIRTRRRRR